MRRLLVVSADDFGLTAGVTTGIIRRVEQGIVSSTSIMPGVDRSLDAEIEWALSHQGHVGIHLQLTQGVPCSPPASIPSIVDRGLFPNAPDGLGTARREDIEREWWEQVERVLGWGIRPSHINSHHHVHELRPAFDVYCDIAAKLGVPARATSREMRDELRSRGVLCTDGQVLHWSGPDPSRERLASLLREGFRDTPEDWSVELMCHPGYVDSVLPSLSKYVHQRELELEVLSSDEWSDMLNDMGVDIRMYSGLAARGAQQH